MEQLLKLLTDASEHNMRKLQRQCLKTLQVPDITQIALEIPKDDLSCLLATLPQAHRLEVLQSWFLTAASSLRLMPHRYPKLYEWHGQ